MSQRVIIFTCNSMFTEKLQSQGVKLTMKTMVSHIKYISEILFRESVAAFLYWRNRVSTNNNLHICSPFCTLDKQKTKTITKDSTVKMLCQHAFAKMQIACSLEELLFYYKNLCSVLLSERSNSKTKAAYEELI